MSLPNEQYLKQLNRYLTTGNILAFERLVNRLQDDGINLDLTQIPNIERKISDLVIAYLIPNYNIEEVFAILQFANDYQLFSGTSIKPIISLSPQERALTIANLESMFGPLSKGFLDFIVNTLANKISDIIVNPAFLTNSAFLQFEDEIPLSRKIEFLHYLIDNYSYYGLRSRKIGNFKEYYKRYKKHREKFDKDYYAFEIEKSEELDSMSSRLILFFQPAYEKHLINATLLERVKKKFELGEYGYEFPLVSMVIYGGLGPEGKGFTYLVPPTAEIIEICSDAKQTKAYVIEYKKYLKSIFLKKLEKHMQTWNLPENLKIETFKFLDANIRTELVHIDDIVTLLEEDIISYLREKVDPYLTDDFIAFLKKSLIEILLPVKMEDQFKIRMDLIKNNKLSETEVAKLASLGNVSHYDLLNQRFFFQNLINNIERILKKKHLL